MLTSVIHRKHVMYKGTASDGYSNIFFTDVESGRWIEEDLGFTDLAVAIGAFIDQQHFRAKHFPKTLIWRRVLKNDVPILFGFAFFMHGEQRVYEIYHANKKYMYTLVQHIGEEWELLGAKNALDADSVDMDFLLPVIERLTQYNHQENRHS